MKQLRHSSSSLVLKVTIGSSGELKDEPQSCRGNARVGQLLLWTAEQITAERSDAPSLLSVNMLRSTSDNRVNPRDTPAQTSRKSRHIGEEKLEIIAERSDVDVGWSSASLLGLKRMKSRLSDARLLSKPSE